MSAMRMASVLGGFLFFFFVCVGVADAATLAIPGAAGRVEYWHPLGPQRRLTFVVTHESWGPPGSGRGTARSQSGGRIGTEWWVLVDGTILHSDRERVTGHCGGTRAPGVPGNCNTQSVGIEFEGFGRLTEPQVRSGLALIRFLQERYCVQPTNIAAHRKARGGQEGVPMMEAAKNAGYRPKCDGSQPSGDISDSSIRAAMDASRSAPTSVFSAYQSGQPSQGYTSPYAAYAPSYDPGTPTGLEYITQPGYTGVFGPPMEALQFPPVRGSLPGESALEALKDLVFPDVHEGEGDDEIEAEGKKNPPLQDTDPVYIIDPSASTTRKTELGEVTTEMVGGWYVPRTKDGGVASGTRTTTFGENAEGGTEKNGTGGGAIDVRSNAMTHDGRGVLSRLIDVFKKDRDREIIYPAPRQESGGRTASALWVVLGILTLGGVWWAHTKWWS